MRLIRSKAGMLKILAVVSSIIVLCGRLLFGSSRRIRECCGQRDFYGQIQLKWRGEDLDYMASMGSGDAAGAASLGATLTPMNWL